MNNNMVEGNWKMLKGKIRQQWGKLTDNDMDAFKGNAEEAIGKIQKAYGYTKDKAREEYRNFKSSNSSLFGNETIIPHKSEKSLF
jgi:uncharacterized protein YjbJ (UPF0337 family)